MKKHVVEYDTQGIPVKMPLLEQLAIALPLQMPVNLSAHLLIAIQHLQGSTVPLLASLMDMGICANNIFVIGKAYSSHPAVVDRLRRTGMQVVARENMLSPANPYEYEIEQDIRKTLTSVCGILKNNKQLSVLMLDEGGKAIRILHELFPSLASRFKCVEQTSRGIKEIENDRLLCPVINVARSRAKQQYETPLIGASMCNNLMFALSEWNKVFYPRANDILLIGYGVVGRAFASELLRIGFRVTVSDIEASSLRCATDDGITVAPDFETALARATIVVGCTGKELLNSQQVRSLPPGVLLVNGASSDIEFSAWHLRANGDIIFSKGHTNKSRSQLTPWENLYRFTLHRGFGYLANGGFPINFDGSMDPIQPEQFQITRSLMFGASLQASCTEVKGICDLDDKVQAIVDHWAEDASRMDFGE